MNRFKELVRTTGMAVASIASILLLYFYSVLAQEAVRCYYAAVWGMRLVLNVQCEAFLNYSMYLLIIPVSLFCFSALAIRYQRVVVQEIIIQCGWLFTVALILWAVCSWTYAFIPPHPAAAIYGSSAQSPCNVIIISWL